MDRREFLKPDILRNLIDQVGAARVVIDTDFPFPVASRDPLGDVSNVEGLDDGAKEAILGTTAARLLKIHPSRQDPLY